jgi:hypothetical protein
LSIRYFRRGGCIDRSGEAKTVQRGGVFDRSEFWFFVGRGSLSTERELRLGEQRFFMATYAPLASAD